MQVTRWCTAALAVVATAPATRPIPAPLPWRWVSERVIAPPEGSKGELGEITSLAIADDGTIYAMQKRPATVLVFGPDGNFLRTVGREGDGPGELRSGVIGVKGDLLMVQDWSGRRFVIFRTNGTHVITRPSLCCMQTSALHVDGKGRAWVQGMLRGGARGYLRIDAAGQILDTLTIPENRLGKTWEADARNASPPTTYTLTVPGHPYEVSALRHDGLMVMGRSDSMRFVVSRTGRDTVRVFEGPTKRQPVTAAEKAKWIEGMVEGLPSTALQQALRKVAKASDIPDLSNAWNGMMVDQLDRTWVGLPAAKGGGNYYGVFDANGKYLGEVPFQPTRPSRLAVMGRDRMVVLEEGDDGLPQIRVYKLVMNAK